MAESPHRTFFILLGAGALVAVVFALTQHGCTFETNPEGEIITQLKRTEREGLSVPIPGAPTLVAQSHHFDRITVEVDLSAHRAIAVSTLELVGKIGVTRVSTLGLERTIFEMRDGQWRPRGTMAPILSRIVSILERRRRALEAGDEAALRQISSEPDRALADPELKALFRIRSRRCAVEDWYLRSERDRVTITEEFHLTGDSPERPIDERGTRRLTLIRRGEEFLFSPRLM